MVGLIILCMLILAPRPCHAQFTPRDGQIIARALSFIEPSASGTLEIGIAYAPERPISLHQAILRRAGSKPTT